MVNEVEGTVLHGMRQLGTQGLGWHFCWHIMPRSKKLKTFPTSAIDLIQGHLRPFQQGILPRGTLRAYSGADTGTNLDPMPQDDIGLAYFLQHPIRYLIHIPPIFNMELNDGKLIPAEAGHQVPLPDLPP